MKPTHYEDILGLKGKKFTSKVVDMVIDFQNNDKYSWIDVKYHGKSIDDNYPEPYYGYIIDSITETEDEIILNLEK